MSSMLQKLTFFQPQLFGFPSVYFWKSGFLEIVSSFYLIDEPCVHTHIPVMLRFDRIGKHHLIQCRCLLSGCFSPVGKFIYCVINRLLSSPCFSKVKRSIFASPESVNGKVGVGTCGIADKPMTQYNDTSKYNVRHLMPQWLSVLCK